MFVETLNLKNGIILYITKQSKADQLGALKFKAE